MGGATNNASVQTGPDLEEIQTEAVGFLALAAEKKVRLLPSAWPADSLPPPTSSLLSVASRKGLVAAAGPDGLVIASTDAVRGRFTAESSDAGNVLSFDPQLKIPLPMRVSQVAFSANEEYLVISAEQGGGLAVYSVQSLMQGDTQAAAELSTNGVSLRALMPNPTPERAELFATVTTNGELMIANLQQQQFVSGANGQVLKQGVSCVAWSARGKQLVAGLGDGTAYQLTPTGEGKAEIPRPAGVDADQHVSSITWLENDLFLLVHTPTSFDADTTPQSTFHLITRQPPSQYGSQLIPDPCPPFGLNRSPPYHFIHRLRNFPPSLSDMLVLASTGSTDIGLFTRSETPLTSDVAAEKIVKNFTMTSIANDSRRAQLSMTEEMSDTSPIGVAIDLSSKEPVLQPIAGEEIDQSQTPLPALFVLNNEGVIAAWWIVYADSIRQGSAYPGLVAVAGSQQAPSSQAVDRQLLQTPPLQSSPGTQAPSMGAFGQSATAQPSAFGSPSTFGRQSPWGSQPSGASPQTASAAFGQPAFGSPSKLGGPAQGSAFGSASNIGSRASPWGAPSSMNKPTTGSAFGQPSLMGQSLGQQGGESGFAALGTGPATSTPAPSGGGFGSYANKGGFVAAASSNIGGGGFGNSDGAFSSGKTGPGSDMDTSFAAPKAGQPTAATQGAFGGGAFTLGSTFKGDGTARDDAPKPASTGGSLFGTDFGNTLGSTVEGSNGPAAKEADMDADSARGEDEESPASKPSAALEQSTTPQSTPMAPRSQLPETITPPTPISRGITGQRDPQLESPASPPSSPSPKIKPEPLGNSDDESIDKAIPEAPLPPEPTSKASFGPGDSSSSSMLSTSKAPPEDAQLPPDFIPPLDVPGGPESGDDEESNLPASDEEGSFEDVARDLSPAETNQSLRATPQSSFGGSLGGSFTQVSKPKQAPTSRPLFGEVGSASFPSFPPPSRVEQSPRSPSPIRPELFGSSLRPDPASRSFSAPGVPRIPSQPERSTARPPSPVRSISRQLPTAEQRKNAQQSLLSRNAHDEELELSDEEDEKVRQELDSELEGKTTLDPFLAHQDYVGQIKKPGVPGQIERLYRDINSMIDTLGLNARALSSFIKGQTEGYKDGGRDRRDLEIEDDWCLIEIQDLGSVQNDVDQQLEDGRVTNVQGKINECREFQKDLVKVRAKHDDIKKVLDTHFDPEQLQLARTAALTSEQAMQQHDLRKDVMAVQKLLADAEEGISLLKARLASQPSATRKPSVGTPTVEAVMSTIMKMTSMAEKKSGDVDVLENQMRRLRVASPAAAASTSTTSNGNGGGGALMSSSMHSTASPQSRAAALRSSLHATSTPRSSLRHSTALLHNTPDRNPGFSASFGSSRGGTPVRNRLGAVTPADVDRVRAKAARKKVMATKVREALARAGPRVQGLAVDVVVGDKQVKVKTEREG
ncbi:MAG: hypothetical protein M1833_000981 [Piccolia ochrophora]|nr:MAG: hypothetical protein M1833_000981 [Piccolia ochrophora]